MRPESEITTGGKAALAAFLVIGLTCTAAGLKMQNSSLYASTGEPVNFSVQGQQDQNVSLEIAPPMERTSKFSMTYSNGSYRVQVPGKLFDSRDRYRYRFLSGQEKFPDSYRALGISSLNKTLKRKFMNSSDTESAGGTYCQFKSNDFTCEYEQFQAYMILSSAARYSLNRTKENRERFYNFTLGSYGGATATCDPDKDFNCEQYGGGSVEEDANAGTRQGTMIYAMWEAYRLAGNETVRELAVNYTGGSANTCDVWNDTFRCENSRAQASMALGYWSAYSMTGNSTFKDIAENLTETNYTGPRTISAYLRGYLYTSNSSYPDAAENRTKKWLDRCTNCSTRRFADLKNALWRGYLYTGDYGYYRNAVNLTSSRVADICSWNQTACKYPNIQGMNSLNYWRAYRLQKDLRPGFYSPRIPDKTVLGRNMSVNVKMQGPLQEPRVQYRRKNASTWRECKLSFFENCTIPGKNLTRQAPYEYRYKSRNTIFPANGTFRFAPSLIKQNFIDEATAFSTNNPNTGCQPRSGDYSCENFALQASMIQGVASLLGFNFSQLNSFILKNLVSRPYVTSIAYTPLCTVKDGYMSCSEGANGADEVVEGSTKQGKMISSLFSAYRETGKNSYYQKALNYTRGSAQDCDVWNQTYDYSFRCNSSLGQASMIKGYLEAYTVTGNRTYREKALNLTEKALSMNGSAELGSALWKSSSMFNESFRNLSVTGNASNISSNYTGYCVGNCTPDQHTEVLSLFQSAYLNSNSDYSSPYRDSLLNTTAKGYCGPFKKDTACDSPLVQGNFMDLFWKASYTMPVKLKVNDTFSVSKSSLKVGDTFKATCSVGNELNNTVIKDLSMNISLSKGLSLESNQSYYSIGDLDYGNSSTESWDLKAVSAGSRNASCITSSNSAYRDALVRSIEVKAKKKKQNSTGGSGASSSGSFFNPPGGEPEKEPENITIEYNNTSSMEWNRSFLNSIGVNTSLRKFYGADSCVNATRKLYQGSSELVVDQACSADSLLVIDRNDQSISVQNARTSNNYTVKEERGTRNVSSITVDYSERGNASSYSEPLVLAVNRTEPPIRFREVAVFTVNDSRVHINATLNRKAPCMIRRDGELLKNFSTSWISYSEQLRYGNTSYRVKCGNRTVKRTFTLQRPEDRNNERSQVSGVAVTVFVAAVFAGLIILLFHFRHWIRDELEMKLFEHRFSRFQDAVDRGDTASAIKAFQSMSRDVSEQLIESDMDLMEGLLLYLLLDLVEEGKEDDVDFDVSGDLDSLVNRYLDGSEGNAARLVREKYGDVMDEEEI